MEFIKEFFGIEENKKNYGKGINYKITKKELCEKLGFKEEEIYYIQYDYKKRILTICKKEGGKEKNGW